MSKANQAKQHPRAVPAAGAESRIDAALGALYLAQGLAAGARLLAARAAFKSASDKDLRRRSCQMAKRALASCARLSGAVGNLTGGEVTRERFTAASFALFDIAQGEIAAAVALLDASQDRDSLDESIQALDLYRLALEQLEEGSKHFVIAHQHAPHREAA